MKPPDPAVLARFSQGVLSQHVNSAFFAVIDAGTGIRKVYRALFDGDDKVVWTREELARAEATRLGALTPLGLMKAVVLLRDPRKLRMLHAAMLLAIESSRLVREVSGHLLEEQPLDEDDVRARVGHVTGALGELFEALGPAPAVPVAPVEEHDGAVVPPARYNAPGEREAIDLMRDLLGDEAFAAMCFATCVRYGYRRGKKGDEEENRVKRKFYRQMGLHVQSGGRIADPREDRGDAFVPYVRQPYPYGLFGLAVDPDMGPTALLDEGDRCTVRG